ncbi:MAG: hypothetical protein ACRERC_06070 [Candidatus Binatia bacterium]
MIGVPLNPTALALAIAIAAGSGVGLWWLLRREAAATLLAVAAITCLTLALRLFDTYDFPRGLNEDEPKVLYAAGRAIQRNTLLAESNISVPILMHALFNGQLIPVLGIGHWAIRGYSLVGSVLCAPAMFAVARALSLSVGSSLAAAALLAVLPWAMFYGRVMQGAELTFQQLLLLAALARLIFAEAPGSRRPPPGWHAAALGGFALGWLLWGYWCTRAMLVMPVVAAALAPRKARWWCLAILLVGGLLYAPYVVANRHSVYVAQGVNIWARFADPLAIAQRSLETLSALIGPHADDGWLTIRAVAMHPWLLLVLAGCGALSGGRRGLFLLAGFAAGLAPSVFAWGPPSTHRMLMAFPFIALAVACGLDDLVPRRQLRRAATLAVVLATAWLGLGFYFSDECWPEESRWKFDWPRTELAAALPLAPGPPVILMRQLSFFGEPRRLLTPNDQDLVMENWLPGPHGGVYAFTDQAAALRPFYDRLLGVGRVTPYGGGFTLTLEARDWTWLRAHGWTYEVRCGDDVRTGQVPTLFQAGITFAGFFCEQPTEHRWQGRWQGSPTTLRLRCEFLARVETPGQHLAHDASPEPAIDFAVEPGMPITISTTSPPRLPWVRAALFEVTQAGERVPDWENVVP